MQVLLLIVKVQLLFDTLVESRHKLIWWMDNIQTIADNK
jgi:hypothetical protein